MNQEKAHSYAGFVCLSCCQEAVTDDESFPLDCQQDRGNRCIGRLSGLMRAANTDSDTDKLPRLAEII